MKPLFDAGNSASWFLMDVAWAAQLRLAAFPLMALTVASGIALVIVDERKHFWGNLALNGWISLNALWMLSDLLAIPPLRFAGLGAAALAVVFIAIGAWRSGDLAATLGQFRRLRRR